MKVNMVDKYNKAKQEIYDHVGFVEDWVIYPIQDHTESYWGEDGESVKYADSIDQFNSDGDYYEDDIYTQRFYKKWVYEGELYTMIFCDPHVDGCRWFRIFDNSKKQY